MMEEFSGRSIFVVTFLLLIFAWLPIKHENNMVLFHYIESKVAIYIFVYQSDQKQECLNIRTA